MKSFQFPLEKVLAFRKRQWEAEAAMLESLIANRAHLEAERRRIQEAMDEAARQLASSVSVSSAILAEFRMAQAGSREAVREIGIRLTSVHVKITEQQRVFLEARRNYELVLRLREKRYAEWQSEVQRQEEADATESFLGRFTQRRLALNSRMPAPAQPRDGTPLRSAEPANARSAVRSPMPPDPDALAPVPAALAPGIPGCPAASSPHIRYKAPAHRSDAGTRAGREDHWREPVAVPPQSIVH